MSHEAENTAVKTVECENVSNLEKKTSENVKRYIEKSPAERLLGEWSKTGKKAKKAPTRQNIRNRPTVVKRFYSCFCFGGSNRSRN